MYEIIIYEQLAKLENPIKVLRNSLSIKKAEAERIIERCKEGSITCIHKRKLDEQLAAELKKYYRIHYHVL